MFRMDEKGIAFDRAVGWTLSLPEASVLLKAIVRPYARSQEGELVRSVAVPWRMIVQMLEKNPALVFQISYRSWEEMVAAAFDQDGYDEVTLTPRSGDRGRDVIAVKRGVGSVRIVGSVKAYRPGHLVKHHDVRELLGVLNADQLASKAILTTTSDFAPRIAEDTDITRFIPYRLELMNGSALMEWLSRVARG